MFTSAGCLFCERLSNSDDFVDGYRAPGLKKNISFAQGCNGAMRIAKMCCSFSFWERCAWPSATLRNPPARRRGCGFSVQSFVKPNHRIARMRPVQPPMSSRVRVHGNGSSRRILNVSSASRPGAQQGWRQNNGHALIRLLQVTFVLQVPEERLAAKKRIS